VEVFLSASLGKNGTIETLILFFVYTIFCLNFACILKILLPNQVCIKKEPNEKPNVLKNLNQIFLKIGKNKSRKKIMIKDLILPKSMLCVVKKYSMNGCEMSSLFLGHFIFSKWYLKNKQKKKNKPNWKIFGKKE